MFRESALVVEPWSKLRSWAVGTFGVLVGGDVANNFTLMLSGAGVPLVLGLGRTGSTMEFRALDLFLGDVKSYRQGRF